MELKDIIIELKSMYIKNGKLTVRMIDRNKYIPTMNTLKKKYGLKSILDIYKVCDIEPDKSTLNLVSREKYDIEDVKKKLNERNITLLTEKLIDGCFTKVECICSCGGEIKGRLCDILNKNTLCIKCGRVKSGKKRRLSYEELLKTYSNNSCELISEYEEYEGLESYLTFKCSCGNIDKKSYASFKLTPKCKKCLSTSKGESHYAWKGGISPLHEHLRKVIYKWKVDSFKKYSYQCDITKSNKKLVIHHLYNFSDIMNELLDGLKLPIKQKIGEYSEEELKSIEEKCLELHYKYGLGICLTEELHKEFHSIYGLKNNTLEQYLEFKENKLKEMSNGGIL